MMNSDKSNIFLFAFFIILSIITAIKTDKKHPHSCGDISQCKCTIKRGTMQLICERDEAVLKVFYTKNRKSLVINCENSTNNSIYNSLDGLKLEKTMDKIYIKNCALPNQSFQYFLEKYNAYKVFDFMFIAPNHFPFEELKSLHFSNFFSVKKLCVYYINITHVQPDLLSGVPNIDSLYLQYGDIKNLVSGIFNNVTKLKNLGLLKNNLTYLHPNIFSKLNQLEYLTINSNQITSLSRPIFNGLTKLNYLDISHNKITHLPSDVFADLINLETLLADGNHFETFPPLLFSENENLNTVRLLFLSKLRILPGGFLSNKQNLETVTIWYGTLKSIPSDIFWNSTRLYSIDLSYNRIMSLPNELFRDTKNLGMLELHTNKLSEFPEGLFEPLENLETLNLKGNVIQTIKRDMFKGLRSLVNLNMKLNYLSYIEAYAFNHLPSLVTLDLSNNYIKFKEAEYLDLSTMWNFSKLKYLNLEMNNISTKLDRKILQGNASNEINLSHNNISIIDINFNDNHLKKGSARIYLLGNPISCDCRNYNFFLTLLQRKELIENQIEYSIESINCTLNKNELLEGIKCKSEDCPDKCICSYFPHTNSIRVDCSSSSLKQLPEYLPRSYNDKNITIQLNMSNNLIEQLPNMVPDEYKFVTDLNLSYNKIRQISKLSYFTHLRSLDLSNNNLTYINETLLASLSLFKNLRTNSLSLFHNPWKCDCDIIPFSEFIQSKRDKLKNAEQINCYGLTKPITSMSREHFCPSRFNYIFIGSIVLGVLGLTFAILMSAYYKHDNQVKYWLYKYHYLRWLLPKEKYDWNKKYDAFISFAKEDDPFVLETLVPTLEKNNYKISHHLRDFVPGEWIRNQILKSVQESRRTIIVLSNDFLRSKWGLEEFNIAYSQRGKDNYPYVIIIMYGEIIDTETFNSEIKAYTFLNTYIKWGDPYFWEKLDCALRHEPEKLIKETVC